MLLLYFIFVHFVLLVPAYGLLQKLGFFAKDSLMQLCMAYVLSICTLGGAGIGLYALDLPKKAIILGLYLFIFFGTFCFLQQKSWKTLMKNRFILLLFVIMSVIPTLVITLSTNPANRSFIPDPDFKNSSNYNVLNVKVLNFARTNANDNYIPYRQAQFFVNNSDPVKDSFINEWGVSFFQRTVLMGSTVSSFYTILNDKPPIAHSWASTSQDPDKTYAKFQIIAHILNSLLILPAFLLIGKLFDKKTALLASIFIASSHFYMYNAIFSWPKSLTAFFILLSIYFLLDAKRSSIFLSGLLAGVAYFAHDLAIVFIGTSIVYLLLKSRFKDILFYLLAAVPIPAIWAYVSSVVYQKQSSFILYPFVVEGLPKTDDRQIIFREYFATSPWKILRIKLDGVLQFVSPYQLISSENGKVPSERLWALGIETIPGSMGIGMFALGGYALFSSLRKIKWEVWFFTLFPIFIVIILFGDPRVLGSLHFSEPIIALLLASTIYLTLGLKKYSERLLMIGFCLNIAYTLYFVAYSFDFEVGLWLGNLNDTLGLTILFCILGSLFYAASVITLKKPSKISKLAGIREQLT